MTKTLHFIALLCLSLTCLPFMGGCQELADAFGRALSEGFSNHTTSIEFSPDGTLAAQVLLCGRLNVWELDGGVARELEGKTCEALVLAVVFSGEETLTVAYHPVEEESMGNLTIGRWNVRNGERRSLVEEDARKVAAVAFSPDGKTAAVCGTEVVIWDIERGDKQTFAELPTEVRAVAFHPMAERLLPTRLS